MQVASGDHSGLRFLWWPLEVSSWHLVVDTHRFNECPTTAWLSCGSMGWHWGRLVDPWRDWCPRSTRHETRDKEWGMIELGDARGNRNISNYTFGWKVIHGFLPYPWIFYSELRGLKTFFSRDADDWVEGQTSTMQGKLQFVSTLLARSLCRIEDSKYPCGFRVLGFWVLGRI